MKYEVYYEKGNGYCYKDEQGKIVSETYKNANPFDENSIALVCDFFDNYYYINEKFEKISPVYRLASNFFTVGNKRMAVTHENSKSDWYFIDQNFKKISPPFSSLFSIWASDYYNNNDKLPFITLNCTDCSDTNFPDYYLDTNFQQVSPRYHSARHFEYFAPLDENCAEVTDVVDGKMLYYLINEDFVKITHGVENWPSNWSIFLDHTIPEKVKSNKTYSRILSGELITQASQTDEVQLENTSADTQSVVEMVKKGTLHSDNSTSTEENKTTSNSTSTIVTQSENIAPKEDAQPKKKPATPQEKKSVVELVKEGSLSSNNSTVKGKVSTSDDGNLTKSQTQQKTSQQPISKPKNIPTCKYTKCFFKTHPGDGAATYTYWAFKDKDGREVGKNKFRYIGDFDNYGIAEVQTDRYPWFSGSDPVYYYININLEKVSDEYAWASEFYRIGDRDIAIIKDKNDKLMYFINREFKKISRGYKHNSIMPAKKEGFPFPQIVVTDDHPTDSVGCQHFLDKNLNPISPELHGLHFFCNYNEEYGEYIAQARIYNKNGGYGTYLINEDFVPITPDLSPMFDRSRRDKVTYSDIIQQIIPEKVKSNKTYSRAMTGENPQDELLVQF